MIISLQAFQTVHVDTKNIAQVGGGVRLGNLAVGIYNQSKRALPHGVCPGVGIGGHATHGGYCKNLFNPCFLPRKPSPDAPDKISGYSSRIWGLTLDTIVALDVVLANGSFIHATSTEYTDIFWVSVNRASVSPFN